jgi:2-polyprenyl-3-methyl-5-hydroxy-6-metoxy-1,4-benzoquinol methylase
MSATEDFKQAHYWIKRHEDLKGDPRSVGNLSASLEQNKLGEDALIDTVGAIASTLRSDGSSVLDLGCGYGRVTGAFLKQGFDYTGFEVSPVAIAKARESWPDARFQKKDLLEWEPDEQYDLVTLLYVLVHFVEDSNWSQFFTAAAKSVAPGGYLIIADEFPEQSRKQAKHFVARPLAEYSPLMSECGLSIDSELWTNLFSSRPHDPSRAHFKFLKKQG